MALIVPDSVVELYRDVPITEGQQIVFSSPAEQKEFFQSRRITNMAGCSYIRRTGRLRIEWPTSQVSQANYIAFRNPAFENKVFFARILDYEYVNNMTTDVLYAIDYFQTYMFDVTYEQCYIEREHLSEADAVKAENNPFDPSIYEFQTAENLDSSPEIEEIYSVGDDIKFAPSSATNISCIVLQIANFDTSELESYSDFLTNFSTVITSGGAISGTVQPVTDDTLNIRIPRAYGLYAINGDDDALAGNKGYTIMNAKNQSAIFQAALDWLTLNNLSHMIIGAYIIPKTAWYGYLTASSFGVSDIPDDEFTTTISPRSYSVTNKKLLLSPYQYIRVYNNEGDVKEYKYEMFSDIRNGGGNAKFRYLTLFDGAPMVSLLPYKYKYDFGSQTVQNFVRELNVNERIDIHNILQAGYSTDAYLAFLSSQYQKTIGSETKNTRLNILTSGVGGILGSIVRAAAGGISMSSGGSVPSGILGNVASGVTQIMNLQQTIQQYNEADAYRRAAAAEASAIGRGDIVSDVFGVAKSAYVADEYHAGTSNGSLPYYAGVAASTAFYTVVRVKLLDTILVEYDKYFTSYGYASNRLGIPRVCEYMSGGSNMPQFLTVDGHKATYVKTRNIHVLSTMKPVSDYIETLFNSGCRFLKGSEL